MHTLVFVPEAAVVKSIVVVAAGVVGVVVDIIVVAAVLGLVVAIIFKGVVLVFIPIGF